MRHVLVMTGTGAIGLLAIFIGDLANIIFLSFAGDVEVISAAGFGTTILFLMTSIGIGVSIATAAIVSPALGAGYVAEARRLGTSSVVASALVALASILIVWPSIGPLLTLLGATGRAQALASHFLAILIPTFPALCIAMTLNALLRSLGDAARAMHVTLGGAIINVILDAVLILGLGFGLTGAAWSSVIARLGMLAIGLYGSVSVHRALARPSWPGFLSDAPTIARVAVPAVLTNVATPIGGAFVTAAIARYGDAAVAAFSIISRLNPVAFGALFALSGSISPVLGQNLGARRFDRVRATLTDSIKFATLYSLAAWIVMALATGLIVTGFHATGEAASLIKLYCRWLSPWFLFLGVLFVANAAFNTMGRPELGTAFNWARATLGTIPVVAVMGSIWGAPGILAASTISAVPFAVGAIWLSYRIADQREREAIARGEAERPVAPQG